MLGKLIKHEFRAVSKILGILHLALGFITVIGMIAINFGSTNENLQMISGFTLVMYILILLAVAVAVTIYLVVRFYRNIFTDEGYLMNTLPVKSYELIFSKLIVSFVWCIINVICTAFSIFLLCLSQSTLDDISVVWVTISNELLVETGVSMWTILPFIIIGCIISALYMFTMFYASIAIGQTFKNHKVLFSLGAYVVLYFISQIISTLALIPFGFVTIVNTDTVNLQNTIFPIMCLSYLASFALLVIYFVITNYIMNKKLNLE